MDYFETPEDVRCAKCAAHPNFIIWDYTFDYDGNGLSMSTDNIPANVALGYV
jgi:hypothetical protein